MFSPLLMMRTRGLIGPFVGKHFKVPGLSRSAGNAHATGGPSGPPVWDASLPEVNVPQNGAWTQDLNDFTSGADPQTFAIVTGGLPTGITLNSNGTFSGTVTNLGGSGSVTYSATNSAGAATSTTQTWSF
ncbi:hypothetical protein DRQ25_10820 [Candidatus Fermentibacteria bacterium]|nr:MAG: hypothetical protein DRQ25_10820 [Candidatus Fermentibacteria bacterium]